MMHILFMPVQIPRIGAELQAVVTLKMFCTHMRTKFRVHCKPIVTYLADTVTVDSMKDQVFREAKVCVANVTAVVVVADMCT